jgi:myosin heavy subunit
MQFVLNDLIWIYPHEELSWAVGQIVEIEEDAYIVKALDEAGDSLYRVEKENALPVHPSCLEGVYNLLDLGEFNEGTLLSNIRVRYSKSDIYTSIGDPILISVNPYKPLEIYSEKFKSQFKTSQSTSPHLFKVAQNTLKRLSESNQSIIISGESGSGKTEAGKILIDFLAGQGSQHIRLKIIDSNPLLEAFGNAKTLKNNNSSRFGKFIELYFDMSHSLQYGKIQVYLLEKSRIVYQAESERNYHFFYQLCAGASTQDRKKFKILSADEYLYLIQGECLEIEGVDDRENYRQTINCMKNLGFSDEDIDWVKRITTGVLYLGNLVFAGEDKAVVENEEDLKTACQLLAVDFEGMAKVLLTRVIIDPSNKEEIVMPQKLEQSIYIRDATAKSIYSDLFNWIVQKINQNIYKESRKKCKMIGILDIYGFEVFDDNSFEQFCINFANEKLQQHFNHHMFKLEQSEYSKEGIDWKHIHYEDNQECLDLIEKQFGLIDLLDEQSKLPKGSDKIFLSSIYSKVSSQKLSNPGVFKNEFFGIEHYAGTVFYNVLGFLDKNRDFLNPSLQSLLETSQISFIITKKSATSAISAVSVASQFKNQLNQLIKTLSASNPSFIRCIKPNTSKSPMEFNSLDVQNQLRCAGLLECIRIRKAGYSVRRNFKEFLGKYGILYSEPCEIREKCRNILKKVAKGTGKKEFENDRLVFQVGKNTVFMKDSFRSCLDEEYAKVVYQQAVKVQMFIKGSACRRRFLKIRKAVDLIEKEWKKIQNCRKKIDSSLVFRSIFCKLLVELKKSLRKGIMRKESAGFEPSIQEKDLKRHQKSQPVNSDFSTKENTSKKEENLEKNIKTKENFQSSERKKYIKDLTETSSSIVSSLHDEIRKLDSNLQKEREKTRRLEDQSCLYKENYEKSLKAIQQLKFQQDDIPIQLPPKESSNAEETKSLKRELKSKNNEIEILNLKLQTLTQQLEENEETLTQYREKEAKWRKNLENEVIKNTELLEKLQILKNSPEIQPAPEKPENLSLKIKINELQTEVETLKTFESSFKKEKKKMKDELDLKNQKIILLEYQVQNKNVDSESNLIELIEKKDEEILEYLSQIESLKIEVGISRSMEKTYKKDIENLKKNNMEKQQTLNECFNEINELKNQLQRNNRSFLEAESLGKVENSKIIEQLKEKVNELNEEIEDRNSELEASKNVYSTLMSILKLKNSEIEVYKQPDKSSQELTKNLNAIRQREKELFFE